MNDPQPKSHSLHLQISGDLPWCVLGWRLFEHEDIEPELAAVYGPVPSQDAAEQLAQELPTILPGTDTGAKFTVVPFFPVRPLPAESGVAPN